MLEKIKRKIVQKIVNIYPSIIEEVERKKLRLIKEGLKSVGNDFYVTFPSIFNGTEHIEIGDNFKCRHMFRIEAIESYNGQQFTPSIVIGNDVQVEANCHIGAINQIVISDNVLIASNVYISDHFHGDISKKELATPPSLRKLSSKGGVFIGRNVWIGDSVSILPGVSLGENVIVGANSVVTKSFPANVVIAGSPAVILKRL